jgi:hypothetical protein
MTRENVPGIVDLEIGSMREAYGGRSICSAISKALWMMKRHPVVILDSFARRGLQRLGLRPGHDTYREYFNSWFRFFDQQDTKDGLGDALEWLRNSPFAAGLFEEGYIQASELDSLWFRNRVTDVWLCFHGGADWLDA